LFAAYWNLVYNESENSQIVAEVVLYLFMSTNAPNVVIGSSFGGVWPIAIAR
jgi:hypothetical protein